MKRLHKWLKTYFIPHEENEYKPHFLRHRSVLMIFFVVIIIELGFLVQVFLVFDKTKFLAAVLPGVLTSLTNEERAENNAPPLVQNDLLTRAAQLKAEDMATRQYFAHTSPDGKSPWYWFNQVNYRYSLAGENLAVNFFESEDVARAWMNSPTHRANIVKKDYTEIGIGVANGIFEGRNTVFVAQLFGKPAIVAPTEAPKKTPVVPSQPTPAIPPPVATPPTVATPTPIATQILGEEVDSPTTVKENTAKKSTIVLSVEKILTSPRQSVTYAYGGMALLIILSLLLAFFIKFEIQHPLIILRGVALFSVVILLLFANIKMSHLETRVPTSDITGNVIEILSP